MRLGAPAEITELELYRGELSGTFQSAFEVAETPESFAQATQE
jgi:hypothetical protein